MPRLQKQNNSYSNKEIRCVNLVMLSARYRGGTTKVISFTKTQLRLHTKAEFIRQRLWGMGQQHGNFGKDNRNEA